MHKRRFPQTGMRWLWVALTVLLVDRYSKWWVMHHLPFFTPYFILPVLNFTLMYNKGAAFGFLNAASGWQNLAFTCFSLLMSVLIGIWLARIHRSEQLESVALNLILGGALGNVWDRLVYGYVVDFLDFHIASWHFAIFNVADSAICIGTMLLLLQWGRGRRKTNES